MKNVIRIERFIPLAAILLMAVWTVNEASGKDDGDSLSNASMETVTGAPSWLRRDLPDSEYPGRTIYVKMMYEGGTSCVIETRETVPSGWTVVSPAWTSQNGDEYIWDHAVLEYRIRAPSDAPAGAYIFSGIAKSYHPETGIIEHETTGETQMDIYPTPLPTSTHAFPPTYTPTVPRPYAYYDRILPLTCLAGEAFEVRFHRYGSDAIATVWEIVPPGWVILSPPWSDVDESMYSWDGDIGSYIIEPPDDSPECTYYFRGETQASNSYGWWNYSTGGDESIALFIPTPTPVPTQVPTNGHPTYTPTPAPSPTSSATPAAEPGLDLILNSRNYHAGMTFKLEYYLYNFSQEAFRADIWILLDVYGEYWFYPSWKNAAEGLDFEPSVEASPQSQIHHVVLEFVWPAMDDSQQNLYFFGAAFKEGSFDLIGKLNEIGWGFTGP